MTVLDRSSGVFNTATGITITRSSGNFGTGTTIVVAIFGNTTFTTPSGWTQRLQNVANMGLYAFERTGAGESNFAFTANVAGSGMWYAWELSAGSTWVNGSIVEQGTLTQVTTPTLVPTAGNRHMLAVCGGSNGGTTTSVTGFSNSFINVAGGQATTQDRPFSARADRDLTADGTSSYTTTATFSASSAVSGAMMMAYVNAASGPNAPSTVPAIASIPAMGVTTGTGTSQSLYTTQTPSLTNVSEGVPVTLGTTLVFAKAGNVTGARFFAPTTVGTGQIEAVFYQVTAGDSPGPGTGTVLGTATFPALAAGAWNTVNFSSAIPVLANTAYRIAVRTSEGRYTATGGFFGSAAVVNGDITGIQSGTNPTGVGTLNNGTYVTNNTGYPNLTFNSTSYFIDVVYAAQSSGPVTISLTPVAATASVPAAGAGPIPPTVVMGLDRPVIVGGSVLLDAVATAQSGSTISSYLWEITVGSGSLSNATTSAATYNAPGSGSGTAAIRLSVTAGGRTTQATMTVAYGANLVAAENQLTGTARASWDLASPNFGGVSTLQGFLDGFTVDKGSTANFKIAQSDTAGWTAEVFRLGYYGGNGARSYGTLTPTGGQLTASQSQPAPTDVDPDTTLPSVDCSNWSTTLTWTPPAWVPSGMFILKLNRTGGGTSHILFVVRDDARRADLTVMPADSTWNAYNAWGGMGGSMYSGNSLYYGTSVNQYDADCARYVSYNRPVINRGAADSGRSYGAVEWSNFFTSEYPMVRFLERNGIDAKYYGCIDAAGDSAGIQLIGNGTTRGGSNAAMMLGHNEYWSDGMRSGWEAASAAGVSIFTCASNEVFWRLVGSSNDASGRPRVWECYKSTIGSRGSTGRTQWTGTWRDPDGASKGGNNPENKLTGTIFAVNGPDLRALVVPFAGGYSSQPLWRHTSVASLTTGQSYTSPSQILGFEWDVYGPAAVTSSGGQFMAAPDPRTRYCSDATYAISGMLLDDAGDVYTSGNATHRLVVKPGGGNSLVFGTGSMNWAFGCDDANAYQIGSDNTSQQIQQATINMLTDMGAPARTLMGTLTQPTAVDWFVDVPMGVVVTSAGVTSFTVQASSSASASLTRVAGTASIGSMTVSAGSSAQVPLTTVAANASIPTPGARLGAGAVGPLVATTASVPLMGVVAGVGVAATAVVATSAVGSVTFTSAAQVGASMVPATAAVGFPAFRSAAAVVLTAVVATSEVPTPGVSSGSATTINADDVEAVAAVPVIAVRVGTTVVVAAVGAATSVPALSVRQGNVVTLAGVSATSAVPQPQVTTQAGTLVSLVRVAASAGVPQIQVSAQAGSAVSLITVPATAAVPVAIARSSTGVAAQAVTAQASVPTMGIRIGVSVRPGVVTATVTVLQPTMASDFTIQMTAVLAKASVPSPRLLMFPIVFAHAHQVVRTRGTHSITINRRPG